MLKWSSIARVNSDEVNETKKMLKEMIWLQKGTMVSENEYEVRSQQKVQTEY